VLIKINSAKKSEINSFFQTCGKIPKNKIPQIFKDPLEQGDTFSAHNW
jgi:hypothetical protein